ERRVRRIHAEYQGEATAETANSSPDGAANALFRQSAASPPPARGPRRGCPRNHPPCIGGSGAHARRATRPAHAPRLIQVALSSVYLSNACSDLSRPLPDCLK